MVNGGYSVRSYMDRWQLLCRKRSARSSPLKIGKLFHVGRWRPVDVVSDLLTLKQLNLPVKWLSSATTLSPLSIWK